jgi:hypothetical protein
MKPQRVHGRLLSLSSIACLCLCTTVLAADPPSAAKTFENPQQAADSLIAAADAFDLRSLEDLFGTGGRDVVLSGEYGLDRQRATEFAAKAREQARVSVDPKNGRRAFLLVGAEDWPFPIPIVKRGAKWSFDAAAGRSEILYRRIGANELDAIRICRGYVDAQHEYALQPREGYGVNQYAQRIISTVGKQDGLAWQNADGTWGGPVGEQIARAIQQGYDDRAEPYHGYFFKVLKGQGPAAPLGELDFLVKGAMIGGFALVAAPAEYGITGVQTFIVSHDGVVYQKDLGRATSDEFRRMDRFNPDKSWTPVRDD